MEDYAMNPDFEFKQLLRAYRAGIITEETFECEMGALENGNGKGKSDSTFRAMGKAFPSRSCDARSLPCRRSERRGRFCRMVKALYH
jgi:hypothetical protein